MIATRANITIIVHTNIFTVILEPGVKSKTEILSAIVQVYKFLLNFT